MQIPKQLTKCRFIKTDEGKRPIEKKWTTDNNYSYDDFEFTSPTYGVLCGHDNLIVVDIDARYIQDKLIQLEEFRKTFTVKTATKKLYHFYFRTNQPNPKTVRFDNIRNERIMDMQGVGTQVIGPGSIINGTGEYEIINNAPISEIDYDYLYTILVNIDKDIKAKKLDDKKSKLVMPEMDPICDAIKNKLTIYDILPQLGIKPASRHENCNCPLGHGSQGGKCFTFTDVVFHCYHCEAKGNIFQLWQKVKKVNFQQAKHDLAKLAGIEESFKQKIIELMYEPKHRPQAIELMAQQFMSRETVYTIRDDHRPEMYIYKDGIFIPNGESYIHEYVRNTIEHMYKETYAYQVIEKVRVDTYISEYKFFRAAPLPYIPFENCVLNLETMEMMDYKPIYRFINKHPVTYDPLAKCPRIQQFIKDIAKGPNDVLTLQELSGYVLWRENKFEKSVMLLGTGRNGKSKYIDLLKFMLGHDNIVNISLNELENNNFAMSNLYGKHANFSPDLSKDAIEATGKFKSLIGRDTITADRKFKTPIQFKNYAKFIFAANGLPYTEDQSDGFFDRWILLDFPWKFVDRPTQPHHKKKIEDIVEQICTPQELSGFVNWSVEGLKRLFNNKRFTISDTTEEIKMKWMRESSSVAGFWLENIEQTRARKDFLQVGDFDFAYADYCIEHNVDQDNRIIKTKALKHFGISSGRSSGGVRGYFGIKLTGKYEIFNVDEHIMEDDDI